MKKSCPSSKPTCTSLKPTRVVANLAAHIRHVAVYRALRATETHDLNPIDVGEPFPPELIPAITSRLKQLQAGYDALIGPTA